MAEYDPEMLPSYNYAFGMLLEKDRIIKMLQERLNEYEVALQAAKETIDILSKPKISESIKEGLSTPLEECLDEDEIDWDSKQWGDIELERQQKDKCCRCGRPPKQLSRGELFCKKCWDKLQEEENK